MRHSLLHKRTEQHENSSQSGCTAYASFRLHKAVLNLSLTQEQQNHDDPPPSLNLTLAGLYTRKLAVLVQALLEHVRHNIQ